MPPAEGFDFRSFAGSLIDAVLLADEESNVTYANRVAETMFGYAAGTLIGQPLSSLMPERYRERHLQGMERIRGGSPPRVVGRTVELHGLRTSGAEFPMELSLNHWQSAAGLVFCGVIRDLTDLKESERRESTQHAITQLIAESRTLMEAVTRVIETICTSMGWETGAMWAYDPRIEALRCVQFWDSQRLRRSNFEKSTLGLQLARGEGLPGRVCESGKSLWFALTQDDPSFMRHKAAEELGLHTALAFPIPDSKNVTAGVLEFFATEIRPPDARLLEMMESIGRQVGALLERAYAVEAVLSIVEQMQVGVLVYQVENLRDDHSLRLISVNPAASEILQIPAEELVGRLIDDNFPQLRSRGLPEVYRSVVETQQSVELEDIIYSDSRVASAAFAVKAFPLPNQCVGVAFENITKRKSAENLLRAERLILERIAVGSSFGGLLDALAGFVEEQTPGMLSSILLLGGEGLEYAAAPNLTPEFVTSTSGHNLHEGARPCDLAVTERETVVITSIRDDERAAGIRDAALQHGFRACWATPIVNAAHEVVGAMALYYSEERIPDTREIEVVEFASRIAAMIIDRRRGEDALRSSEARFRALIQNSADAIHLIDAAGHVIFRSPASERMLGYRDTGSRGHLAFEYIHPEDIDFVLSQFQRIISTGEPLSAMFRVRHHDGRWIHIETNVTNLLADPDIGALVVNFRDVTERHQAEQTLRESEERFNSFMRNAPLVAFIKDAESRYVWVNEEFKQTFAPHGDIKGRDDYAIFDRPTAELNVLNDLRVLHAMEPVDASESLISSNGAERSWLTIKFPLLLSSGERHIGGVAIDVTERNALSDQLERSERMSGLGRLAANIAHEINNVLMGILPFAEVIQRRAESDQVLQSAALHISRGVDRGRRITQDILGFTRAVPAALYPFLCRKWLMEMLPELQSITGAGVRLTLELPEDDFYIQGDALQLHQVISNLVLNARDAMEGSGSLTITATIVEPDEPSPRKAATAFARLTVTDTGPGIPDSIIEKIFEPLFTTKRNAGTGLGLAICHQVIEKHGGEIRVESLPGSGTTFHIFLPCGAAPPDDPYVIRRAMPAARRIVLVEDEISVGEGIVALLESNGVEVRWVRTGAAAEAAITDFEPDVLLLDVGLPDIDGFELYRHLRVLFPLLPTIFSTGHGDRSEVSQLSDKRVTHLQKPYEYETLARTIAAVMRQRPAKDPLPE